MNVPAAAMAAARGTHAAPAKRASGRVNVHTLIFVNRRQRRRRRHQLLWRRQRRRLRRRRRRWRRQMVPRQQRRQWGLGRKRMCGAEGNDGDAGGHGGGGGDGHDYYHSRAYLSVRTGTPPFSSFLGCGYAQQRGLGPMGKARRASQWKGAPCHPHSLNPRGVGTRSEMDRWPCCEGRED